MRKMMMTLAAVLCCHLMLCAQAISEKEAKERALQFMTGKAPAMARGRKIQLKTATLDVSGIYAFNREGGGFVITSADDRAVPVLGYSESGEINWQKMPENMKAWLKNYGLAIKALGNASLKSGSQSTRALQEIAPLIKTQWDQYEPYWNDCPVIDNGIALTGCVATAMAQVMNYHRWPQDACESIPTYSIPNKGDTLTFEGLPATTFDWDKLALNPVDPVEVAKLMRYCGQSVEMAYGTGVSATDGAYMAFALKLFFGYDPGLYYAQRNLYGIDEWEQMIYDELAAGRPVPYCGQSDGGGHAFVCDGYDGSGLFHINWGWSGRSDGYFSLSVLNPYNTSGAGASSSSMGYCMFEEAMIGVQKPTGQTPAADYSSTMLAFSNLALDHDTVKFIGHYDNMVKPFVTFEAALGTIGDDGKLIPLVMAEKQYGIESRYNVDVAIFLSKEKLAAGTYQLVPMARCITTDGPWHLVMAPERKVVTEVTGEGVSLKLAHLPSVTIEKAYVKDGPEIASETNELAFVVNNKGHEYVGELRFRYLNIGDKTAKEVYDNLPPVSEMGKGIRTGGYLRAGTTEEIPVIVDNVGDKGKYLFLLYEDYSDVLLDTATIAFEKEHVFEFVDLEVVAYKFEYDADNWEFKCELTMKNNDANNDWPKYRGMKDCLSLSLIDEEFLKAEVPRYVTDIPRGKDKKISEVFTFLGSTPVTFSIDEQLCDGRSKRIFEIKVNPDETVTYPVSTGISPAAVSDRGSGQIFDLRGQSLKEQPGSGGVYIYQGKKHIIRK